ncbi:XdhC family protein [Nocardia sp. NPDC004068]|uniref:XdhC family protein n=1 Tax=Nocardia sp. NPDC004068 TaxID=3364303 RepID=UPI0036B0DEE2
MRDLAAHLLRWHADGATYALATVVGLTGSAPRPLGTSMAVDASGAVRGSLSGGCVEAAVHDLCQHVLATGLPLRTRFGYTDSDAFAVGLTCGGELDVFIRRITPTDYAPLEAALREPGPIALVTDLETGAAVAVTPDRVIVAEAGFGRVAAGSAGSGAGRVAAGDAGSVPSCVAAGTAESVPDRAAVGDAGSGPISAAAGDAAPCAFVPLGEDRGVDSGRGPLADGGAEPGSVPSDFDRSAGSGPDPRMAGGADSGGGVASGPGHAGLEPVAGFDRAGADSALVGQARAMLEAGVSGVRVVGCTDRERTVFVASFATAPRMIVFGATDFASALCRVGRLLGYRVTVCEARPVFADPARLPDADEVVARWPDRYLRETEVDARTVLCVLTHDPKFDIPVLVEALRLPVAYVGAMGSRRVDRERRARLREAGVTESQLRQLRSPIGLELGGRTPEETAVAIGAEIVAVRRGGSTRPLSATERPIHPVGRERAAAS